VSSSPSADDSSFFGIRPIIFSKGSLVLLLQIGECLFFGVIPALIEFFCLFRKTAFWLPPPAPCDKLLFWGWSFVIGPSYPLRIRSPTPTRHAFVTSWSFWSSLTSGGSFSFFLLLSFFLPPFLAFSTALSLEVDTNSSAPLSW